MIEPWDLTQTNLGRMRESKIEVAVLPTAAIEPHNLHLPQGQDFLHTSHLARVSCAAAWARCQSVILLPALPYGVDCNLMDFPLAIHVSQATLDAMVREIILSLRAHGIRKVVLLNGHGGNNFGPFVRQIQCDTDVHVFLINWWTVGKDKYNEIFTLQDDHAGEMETSVGLAVNPDCVELERAADGRVRPFRFEALRQGWAQTSRRFARMNPNCTAAEVGQPTAEKGKAYLDLVSGRITDFLVELAQTPIDETFPHVKE